MNTSENSYSRYKTILVTGVAGFIGFNPMKRIYQEAPSATVIGIDNRNAYYYVVLKEFQLNELAKYLKFTFVKDNIGNQNPENLLDFVQILSEELVRSKDLPEDYDFEALKELVPYMSVTYVDTSALERDFVY